MPGDMCPVWAEMFLGDGTHVVAPTPHSGHGDALSALSALHPDAIVDELDAARPISPRFAPGPPDAAGAGPMRRPRRIAATVAAAALSAAGFAGCAKAQLAMAPHTTTGCVIPGTRVTVPSLEGARFGGQAHSCVNGTWRPFSALDNAR